MSQVLTPTVSGLGESTLGALPDLYPNVLPDAASAPYGGVAYDYWSSHASTSAMVDETVSDGILLSDTESDLLADFIADSELVGDSLDVTLQFSFPDEGLVLSDSVIDLVPVAVIGEIIGDGIELNDNDLSQLEFTSIAHSGLFTNDRLTIPSGTTYYEQLSRRRRVR